jgi:hypothetical protein
MSFRAPDAMEAGLVNIFEYFESAAALAAWRAVARGTRPFRVSCRPENGGCSCPDLDVCA